MAISVTLLGAGTPVPSTSSATRALSSVTVPAGNLIVVHAVEGGNSAWTTGGSVADTVNTYNQITHQNNGASGNNFSMFFYAKNSVALSSGTITWTQQASEQGAMECLYATGIDPANPLDTAVTATGNNGGVASTAVSLASGTPTNNQQVLMVGGSGRGNSSATTATVSSPFNNNTWDAHGASTGPSNIGICGGVDFPVTTSQTFAATLSTSQLWSAIVVGFRVAPLPPGEQWTDLTPRNAREPTPIMSLRTWTSGFLPLLAAGPIRLPFNQYDWPLPTPPNRQPDLRSWAFSYNPNLIGQDNLPFNQKDWPLPKTPPRLEQTWTFTYNPNLIGQDQLPTGEQFYDLPPRGAEPSPRRSWEFSFAKVLIGQDQLPVGDQVYALPPGQVTPRQPDLRTWTWSYNLDLIGADQLPVGAIRTELPIAPARQPDLRSWVYSTLFLARSVRTVPFNQFDWPLPKVPTPIPQFWCWTYNPNLIGQDQLPVGAIRTELPQGPARQPDLRSWTFSFNLSLLSAVRTIPFNQFDWPLPVRATPIPQGWGYQWSFRIAPVAQVPHNQFDWPLPKVPFQFDRSSFYASPFAPPVQGPASYFFLQPHIVNDQFIPAWTIVTEGVEIPLGWIPTLAVDPLNQNAVDAFYAAGPRPGTPGPEWNWQNWQLLTSKRPAALLPAVTHWEQVAPGVYRLTGLGTNKPPIGF